MQQLVRQTILCGVALLALGSGYADGFTKQKARPIGAEEPVEPADDPVNQTVRRDTPKTALVVVMEFSDSGAQLKSATLATVRENQTAQDPSDFPGGAYTEVIAVDAGGDPVGTVLIPDRRVKIQEHTGVITTASQTASVAIPLSGRPASLRVSGAAFEFARKDIPITSVMDDLCKQYPNDPVCRTSTTTDVSLVTE